MTEYHGRLQFHSETGTEGGYWAFQDEQFIHVKGQEVSWCSGPPCPASIGDSEHWSYDGLKILQNGDWVTIFNDDTKQEVAWEGVIDLTSQDPYASDSTDAYGMAVHSTPNNCDMRMWLWYFFQELPAKLVQ